MAAVIKPMMAIQMMMSAVVEDGGCLAEWWSEDRVTGILVAGCGNGSGNLELELGLGKSGQERTTSDFPS